MRTKALVLSAALVAAGVASSMAQSNVYSLNIVGYVNVNIKAGFNMIANPLDDGLGDTNLIGNVLSATNLPDNSIAYVYSPVSGYDLEFYSAGQAVGQGWFPNTHSISPGAGFFFDSPSNTTITFVGQIAAGSYTNGLAGGHPAQGGTFNLVSSIVPEALPLGVPGEAGTLGIPAGDNDIVYRFDPVNGYDLVFFSAGSGWFDSGVSGGGSTNGPVINVGEGFFIQTTVGGNWVETFSVN